MDQDSESRGVDSRDAERSERPEPSADDDHLADVPDGCGCAEVWEHLSDRRA